MTGCVEDLHAAASAEISDALGRARAPYVACSGGKDSMLLAALVLEVDRRVPVVHSTHGARWLPDRWPGVLVGALRSMGAQDVRVIRRNLIWAETRFDVVFVGLRRTESRRRRKRMREVERLNPAVEEVWPLAGWAAGDVWACTDAHGVPWASTYGTPREGRFHWPTSPIERAEWGRLEYRGGPAAPWPGAPSWLVWDPLLGDLCGECGMPVGDVGDVSAHGEGCWVPAAAAADGRLLGPSVTF